MTGNLSIPFPLMKLNSLCTLAAVTKKKGSSISCARAIPNQTPTRPRNSRFPFSPLCCLEPIINDATVFSNNHHARQCLCSSHVLFVCTCFGAHVCRSLKAAAKCHVWEVVNPFMCEKRPKLVSQNAVTASPPTTRWRWRRRCRMLSKHLTRLASAVCAGGCNPKTTTWSVTRGCWAGITCITGALPKDKQIRIACTTNRKIDLQSILIHPLYSPVQSGKVTS